MMATYFHGGSDMQPGDNLQTLYLMNPNYVAAYTSEAHNNNHPSQPPPTNMLLLNHSAGLGGPGSLPGPQQQPGHQQFIGIPLAGPHSDNPGRPSPSSPMHHHHHHQIPGSLHGMAVSRVHYNLWSPTIDPSPTHPGPGSIPTAVVAGGAQGLSLSLSPHQQQNNNHNNNPAGMGGADDGRMSVTVVGGSSTVSNGVQGVILGSKYLKAAQELLDEVVNVGSYSSKGVNNNNNCESSGAHKNKAKAAAKEPAAIEGSSSGAGESSGGGKKAAEQVTAAQRQELQMKKAKLLNMLDEVEQRYRQYHTQMQVVVSSFEQVAGIGSAKSYTSLALQTISRQFRCLKDAIMSQIKATGKSLGEEDTTNGGSKLEGGGVGSRLRFVDHQLRQQRALQQLGMMQHNAWRPQRGLPERAVSVLRAWLFEHFLHPYPKDSDKHMLAKQTGLTRSQVSNWFINARVRLWKPMVERDGGEDDDGDGRENGVNVSEGVAKPSVKLPRRARSEGGASVNPDLLTIPGVGPRNSRKLVQKGIGGVAQLKQLYRDKFFGKSSQKMVEYLQSSVGIIHRNHAESITTYIKKSVDEEAGEENSILKSQKKRITLCVEGNISVGKTTFLKRIANETLELRDLVEIVPEPIDKWQNIGPDHFNILDAFYAEPKRYAYTFQNYVFVTRVMQERDSSSGIQPLRLMERSVFSDRMVFVRAVHEAKWMNEMEISIYDSWFDPVVSCLPGLIPDGFIYLRASPDTCHKRMMVRKREEEGGVSLDYLRGLHEKHESWLFPSQAGKHGVLSVSKLALHAGSSLHPVIRDRVYFLEGPQMHSSLQKIPALVLDCEHDIDFNRDIDAKRHYAHQVAEFFEFVKREKEVQSPKAGEQVVNGSHPKVLLPHNGGGLCFPDGSPFFESAFRSMDFTRTLSLVSG